MPSCQLCNQFLISVHSYPFQILPIELGIQYLHNKFTVLQYGTKSGAPQAFLSTEAECKALFPHHVGAVLPLLSLSSIACISTHTPLAIRIVPIAWAQKVAVEMAAATATTTATAGSLKQQCWLYAIEQNSMQFVELWLLLHPLHWRHIQHTIPSLPLPLSSAIATTAAGATTFTTFFGLQEVDIPCLCPWQLVRQHDLERGSTTGGIILSISRIVAKE